MLNYIDAAMLKKAFLAGTGRLESKKAWINELNVFPVPDGDTGTNMCLTLLSAVKEMSGLDDNASLEEVGKCLATGTLKGARGNSGVILSQLFRGFSKELEGEETVTADVIARAFDRAVVTAYKAVMKPKEGTILTVAKACATKASELSKTGMGLAQMFEEINTYAEYILSKTPEMLPVLKEAGVVDSGGQGLVEFLEGAFDAFMGKEVDYSVSAPTPVVKKNIDTTAIETSDIKFGYCTEFIINLEVPFGEEDEDELKAFLSSIGDSLVAVHMDDIVKVHVHTNHPGQAFEKGLTYGSLTSMKVDNMREEHNEKVILEADKRLAAEQEAKSEATPVSDIPRKETGFVTVCSGEGLVQVFKNMDVDAVIEGGQTMNPSTEDIVAAINTVNADNVYVLPNNSNIIMTAEQSKYLCEDKNIFVIPSKTVAQGINAVINYMPSLSPEENASHMTESLSTVKTAEVTYAIRDTELDGITVKNGDYMGIGEGHLLAASEDITEAVLRTVKAMGDEDSELITVYYGAEIESDAAEEIGESIEALFPDADVVVIEGGQPVYYYIISIE